MKKYLHFFFFLFRRYLGLCLLCIKVSSINSIYPLVSDSR
ncbi:anti-sigma factor, partial [Parabacteroides distasonis]